MLESAIETISRIHSELGSSFDSDVCDRLVKREISILKSSFGVKSNAKALSKIGIDMSKHSRQPLKSFVDMAGVHKEDFLITLIGSMHASGEDLSDGVMNSSETLDLHRFYPGLDCPKCANCNPLKPVTKQSVYMQAIKTFKGWSLALERACISVDDHQRKVAARSPSFYLDVLFSIFSSTPDWTSKTVKENRHAWNLRHARNQSCLILYKHKLYPELAQEGRWIFAAWVQWKAEGQGIDTVDFYQSDKELLWSEYSSKHLGQEVWDPQRITEELQKVFVSGRRITRQEMERSSTRFDRTLLAASRSQNNAEKEDPHDLNLRKAGFLPNVLRAIYKEEDDPWTRARCFREAQRLLGIYLTTKEPALSRDWCRLNAKEFHDALLRHVNGTSWEAGLRWIGLDPKRFSMHASARTRRGLIFQALFKEQLINLGFNEVFSESAILTSMDFMSGKSIDHCAHAIKCKPDFLFRDFIIDTKTGLGAVSQDNDQLLRYTDHRRIVYLLTLNNKYQEKAVGAGVVIVMSLRNFTSFSEGILGVSVPESFHSSMSSELARLAFRS